MTIKAIPQLFKAALADWREDKATRLAAALAYYTVFSLAPLLIILIGTRCRSQKKLVLNREWRGGSLDDACTFRSAITLHLYPSLT